ncbi:MAG: type III-B CRISPR-associated protein Cas10/Cmr2 [Verrucomicrobiae bacterium]|nr:type III-B CRISPR-associated protein Cas10/Cmr2 [Verrucomicrobiae bacterium]
MLSILDHEERARRIAGMIPSSEMARKEADWAASAADRLPFPPSSDTRTELTCFRHPLGGAEIPLNGQALPIGVAEDTSQTSRPKLNEDNPRAAFISTWRFWRNWAASRHADFALYPAETRLPDHTIWNHLAVTSAMQGCLGGEPWTKDNPGGPVDSPAFLIFTIGPVQDFISAARSTRDLWSGSYLLSYLIGHTLRRIALDFGPDHVIFPNLCDQPIADLLLKEEIWDQVSTVEDSKLFEAFDYYGSSDSKQRLLTPSLPNRFLAVLPTRMVEHRDRGPQFASVTAYAQYLADDLKLFLKHEIAGPLADVAAQALGTRFNQNRFSRQADRLLEVHWQALPWPDTFQGAREQAEPLPNDDSTAEYTPRAGLQTILNLCQHGADTRYLTDQAPKNVAAAWSALYASAEWLLDGAKANRGFPAAVGGHLHPTKDNSKDSLNGREVAVLLVGDEADAQELSTKLAARLRKNHLVKRGEDLGAGTLIKRLWPYAVLCPRHAFAPKDLEMPNTRGIAAHEPWGDDDDDGGQEERYFAVLALDGDSMGKWISGSKAPRLQDVLSRECEEVYRAKGANLEHHRPLSPAWHLQFSEALGNFSQHAVRRIVEAFDGRLVYSGGDDVLAMLPADTALECARALRLAFRGDPDLNRAACGVLVGQGKRRRSDRSTRLFQIDTEGFLRVSPEATDRHGETARLLDDPVRFPAIVPGPKADCSVGIAIAHFKSPLQDVVRAAQAAEKRAKNQFGRGAVAVSLFKRSGEITEWGCKWEDGGLEVYRAMLAAIADESVSGKFPHRVVELLDAYLTDTSPLAAKSFKALREFPVVEIVLCEFRHAIERQGQKKDSPKFAELKEAGADDPAGALSRYLHHLQNSAAHELKRAKENTARWETLPPHEQHRLEAAPIESPLSAVIGLCQTVAFVERNLPKGNRP